MTVDLRHLPVRTLDIRLERGNMALFLPLEGRILGDAVQIDNGNLRLVVPDNTPLRLNLGQDAERPTFVPPGQNYEFLGGVLFTPGVVDFRVLLDVQVGGALTVDRSVAQ
jgi:hypothetical protein